MSSVFVHQMAALCSLGSNLGQVRENLLSATTAEFLSPVHWAGLPNLMLGQVRDDLPSLADYPQEFRGRNNALLALAYRQIASQVEALVQQFGAARIAIVLGTSTSGIGESERAYAEFLSTGYWPAFDYRQQEMYAPAKFLKRLSGVGGPSYVISTACSSGARAIAAGARLLRAGLADAVIVGGVDSLCRFTLAGFHALEALDPKPCRPFSANRSGINIGEAAALLVLRREASDIELCGYGESADAHHMSAPEPEGTQPRLAIESALKRAGLIGAEVDYVNLHGTGTQQNDAMEAGLSRAYGSATRYSSTKAMSGHTLGAAGAIEAIFSCLVLRDNAQMRLPIHHFDGLLDPKLAPLDLVDARRQLASKKLSIVASHSFAFGGSNAVLLFRGRQQ